MGLTRSSSGLLLRDEFASDTIGATCYVIGFFLEYQTA